MKPNILKQFRDFFVRTDQYTSKRPRLNGGVPQGSVFGPVLFQLSLWFLLETSYTDVTADVLDQSTTACNYFTAQSVQKKIKQKYFI